MAWIRNHAGKPAVLGVALALAACGNDVVAPRSTMSPRLTDVPTPGANVVLVDVTPQGHNFQETRFRWSVVKSSDVSQLDLSPGASGTINYLLTFTRTYAGIFPNSGVSASVCLANTGADPTQNLAVRLTAQVSTDGGATFSDVDSTVVDLSAMPVLAAGASHCYGANLPFTPTAGATYRLKVTATYSNAQSAGGGPGSMVAYSGNFSMPALDAYVDGAIAYFSDAITCPDGFTCTSNLATSSVSEVVSDTSRFTTAVSYAVSVTNVSAMCDSYFDLLNKVSGTQLNDNAHKFNFGDTLTVTLHTPPCDHGCSLTIGYWKTHAGFTGRNPDRVSQFLPIPLGTLGGVKTLNVTTATIAYNVFKQNVYGSPSNGITKLYAQLLGTKLNIANGASSTAVASTISAADAFLATHNYLDWASLTSAQQTMVLGWQSMLDGYNNGLIGPGHCN